MSAERSAPWAAGVPDADLADIGCRCGPGSPGTVTWPARGLRATRAATPHAIPDLRQLARRWSEGSALHQETVEDVVLVVNEAVTNVVEHAYPDGAGAVRLQMTRRECGELAVTVEDDGVWRAPPTDPGFRGRGLRLIDGLTDHALVTHTPSGTTVVMGWNPGSVRWVEDSPGQLTAEVLSGPSTGRHAASGSGA